MMQQPPPTPAGPRRRDRSLGLVVFGVVEIMLGVLGLLMVPLTLVAMAASQALVGPVAAPDWRGVVGALAVYGVLAVALIWLGVGSIRARRWARVLLLALSWLWLIGGVCALIASWWLLPALWMQVAGLGDWPRGLAFLAELGTALLLSVVYVALPAAFVLFYRSEAVAETCRVRDPDPSLIGDCPPQVLGLALLFALGALSVLLVPGYGFLLPVFGWVLTGAAGAAGWGLILLLLLWLAWRTLLADPRAWWVAVVATVIGGVSSTVTVAVVPLGELLQRMRLGPQQLALFEGVGGLSAGALALLSGLSWLTLLVYLLFARRWFFARRTAA